MLGIAFAAAQGLGLAGQFASGILSAKARRAEFDEQIRQVQLKKEQTLSLATAMAGASGVEAGSVSTLNYLKGLTGEFDREVSYLNRAKKLGGRADMVSSIFGAAGGAANIYGGLAKANNWKLF